MVNTSGIFVDKNDEALKHIVLNAFQIAEMAALVEEGDDALLDDEQAASKRYILTFGDGYAGQGFYMWDADYPDMGSVFLFESLAQAEAYVNSLDD